MCPDFLRWVAEWIVEHIPVRLHAGDKNSNHLCHWQGTGMRGHPSPNDLYDATGVRPPQVRFDRAGAVTRELDFLHFRRAFLLSEDCLHQASGNIFFSFLLVRRLPHPRLPNLRSSLSLHPQACPWHRHKFRSCSSNNSRSGRLQSPDGWAMSGRRRPS